MGPNSILFLVLFLLLLLLLLLCIPRVVVRMPSSSVSSLFCFSIFFSSLKICFPL